MFGPQPGTPAAAVPYGEDYVQRMLENIARGTREQISSAVQNQAKVNTTLAEQIAAINDVVTDLADVVSKQVEFGSVGGTATGFAVDTTRTSPRTGTITVPSGYTQCIMIAVGVVGVWNGSASSGYMYARVSINGTPGVEAPAYAAASGWVPLTVSAVRTMTGLTPGGSITLSVDVRADTAWGTSGSNLANLDAVALFRR